MTWFVFDMDEGLLGAHATRRAAVHEHQGGALVLKRHKYGAGGDYEYTFGFPGEDTTSTAFIVRQDQAGDWHELVAKWEAAGRPMGRLDEPIDFERADA